MIDDFREEVTALVVRLDPRAALPEGLLDRILEDVCSPQDAERRDWGSLAADMARRIATDCGRWDEPRVVALTASLEALLNQPAREDSHQTWIDRNVLLARIRRLEGCVNLLAREIELLRNPPQPERSPRPLWK